MSAVPNFPTLREELDRKAFETLDWLFTSMNNGKLTPEQFSAGLDALFMAVNGLVDDEIATLITGACGLAQKGVFKRTFVRGKYVAVIEREAGKSTYTLSIYSDGIKMNWRDFECFSSKEAAEKFEARAKRLTDEGFTEI